MAFRRSRRRRGSFRSLGRRTFGRRRRGSFRRRRRVGMIGLSRGGIRL